MAIEISEKETEIIDLRIKLQEYQSGAHSSGHQTMNGPSHQELLIEQQAKELMIARAILEEQENSGNECIRKWNSLLEDNFVKDSQIKALQAQLEALNESYQNTLTDFSIKFNELNRQTLKIIQLGGEKSRREAAEFLVEQMRVMQEERKEVLKETQRVMSINSQLIKENESLLIQLGHFQGFIGSGDFGGEELVAGMARKIEELSDFVEELRRKGTN